MTNHPNRGERGQLANPLPEEIIAARKAAGLTQTDAAGLVCGSLRAWQQWEAGDRRMHPGLWRLFLLESGTTDDRAHTDCPQSEENA
jgi:putative transcriptional regulator